jgi:hypothetical protein
MPWIVVTCPTVFIRLISSAMKGALSRCRMGSSYCSDAEGLRHTKGTGRPFGTTVSLSQCRAEPNFRPWSTPPERGSFKPALLRPQSNPLISPASNIRTKTGVVRLRQRKGPARDEKRPDTGFPGRVCGSDKWPEKPMFCGFPTADQQRKKNVPTGATGGGKLTRTKHSFCPSSLQPPSGHP